MDTGAQLYMLANQFRKWVIFAFLHKLPVPPIIIPKQVPGTTHRRQFASSHLHLEDSFFEHMGACSVPAGLNANSAHLIYKYWCSQKDWSSTYSGANPGCMGNAVCWNCRKILDRNMHFVVPHSVLTETRFLWQWKAYTLSLGRTWRGSYLQLQPAGWLCPCPIGKRPPQPLFTIGSITWGASVDKVP